VCRTFPYEHESLLTYAWRKNTAERWHRQQGGHSAADRVPVRWSLDFIWTPLYIQEQLAIRVLISGLHRTFGIVAVAHCLWWSYRCSTSSDIGWRAVSFITASNKSPPFVHDSEMLHTMILAFRHKPAITQRGVWRVRTHPIGVAWEGAQ